MNLLLIVTHLLAAGAGALGMYVLVTHRVKRREIDGHSVLEINRPEAHVKETTTPQRRRWARSNWVAFVILVAAAIVILIGVQARQQKHADDDQRAKDQAYSRCLTAWADDLAATLQNRSEQTVKLQAAEKHRDDTVDAVLRAAFEAPNPPPAEGSRESRALQHNFRRVLGDAVKAKKNLQAVRAETKKVLARNQYVLPTVACTR